MSTGYGWEGLRQVGATLLGARHVPERPCGGLVYLGRNNKCSPLPFLPFLSSIYFSLLLWLETLFIKYNFYSQCNDPYRHIKTQPISYDTDLRA